MNKKICLFLFVLLSGCVTNRSQHQFKQEVSVSQNFCADQLKSNSIDVLRNFIAVDPRETPTITMLNNKGYPSENEKKALSELDKIYVLCNQSTLDVLQKYSSSDYVKALTIMRYLSKNLIADLATNRIDYGTYNHLSSQFNLNLKNLITQLDEQGNIATQKN